MESSNNIDLPLTSDNDNSFVANINEGCISPLSSWDSESDDDSLLWEIDNRSYDKLLKKCIENEEELRVTNLKLQLSEKEVINLKVQVENSKGQFDNVCEELKLKEDEMHKQKEVSEKEIFK
ncbi:hypothetical protein MtrunA17_Chr3g0128561 [Medicago truncatula]|uniref:Uncharacterized protein n=1 Tax=Medicago truncatula TaxID=3880 RepID=A0A396J3J3_MEDTR|nr:hypothetical protein MtrunA17_Chr3g0128561 [Medicago truncatula]